MGAEMIGGHLEAGFGSLITSTLLHTGGQLLSDMISEQSEVNDPLFILIKSPLITGLLLLWLAFLALEIEFRRVSFTAEEISLFGVLEICTKDET